MSVSTPLISAFTVLEFGLEWIILKHYRNWTNFINFYSGKGWSMSFLLAVEVVIIIILVRLLILHLDFIIWSRTHFVGFFFRFLNFGLFLFFWFFLLFLFVLYSFFVFWSRFFYLRSLLLLWWLAGSCSFFYFFRFNLYFFCYLFSFGLFHFFNFLLAFTMIGM